MSKAEPKPNLAARLAASGSLVTAWSAIADIQIAATLARSGFDAVTLDIQHGQHDYASCLSGIAEIRAAGCSPLARIPVGDFALAGRLLDAGAEAVIAPMINTADDAQALVRSTKYPPLGARSWGPLRAMALMGMDGPAYLSRANDFCLAIAMIETAEAIDNLDAILATEGLDGVLVGPGDLSVTLSNGEAIDPSGKAAQDAMATITRKAIAAGRFSAVFCNSPKDAQDAIDAGARLLAYGVDLLLLEAGARHLLSDLRR
ncbi:MAG: aldolase/citrate lyase family protein [Pseudomonadota bacterium]